MEISIKEVEKLIQQENLHIFLDIDGVLFNSVETSVKLLNEKFNRNVDPKSISVWNFSDKFPEITDEDIEWLFGTVDFFNIVEFQKGAFEFLVKHQDNITLVTKGVPSNLRYKTIFFEMMGLDKIKFIGLPIDQSKSVVDMSDGIFIDDCTYNLVESNAKIKILFKEYDNFTEWSQGWDGLIMRSWV